MSRGDTTMRHSLSGTLGDEFGGGGGGHGAYTKLAGQLHVAGFTDGPRFSVHLNTPTAVVAAPPYLYVGDSGNFRVVRVECGGGDGAVVTVAGDGIEGSGADGPARQCRFGIVSALAVSADGQSLYIADWSNHCVRVLSLGGGGGGGGGGTVRTLVGVERRSGFLPGPLDRARITHPTALHIDARGNLFVTDATGVLFVDLARRVLKVVSGGREPGLADQCAMRAARYRTPCSFAMLPTAYECVVVDRNTRRNLVENHELPRAAAGLAVLSGVRVIDFKRNFVAAVPIVADDADEHAHTPSHSHRRDSGLYMPQCAAWDAGSARLFVGDSSDTLHVFTLRTTTAAAATATGASPRGSAYELARRPSVALPGAPASLSWHAPSATLYMTFPETHTVGSVHIGAPIGEPPAQAPVASEDAAAPAVELRGGGPAATHTHTRKHKRTAATAAAAETEARRQSLSEATSELLEEFARGQQALYTPAPPAPAVVAAGDMTAGTSTATPLHRGQPAAAAAAAAAESTAASSTAIEQPTTPATPTTAQDRAFREWLVSLGGSGAERRQLARFFDEYTALRTQNGRYRHALTTLRARNAALLAELGAVLE